MEALQPIRCQMSFERQLFSFAKQFWDCEYNPSPHDVTPTVLAADTGVLRRRIYEMLWAGV